MGIQKIVVNDHNSKINLLDEIKKNITHLGHTSKDRKTQEQTEQTIHLAKNTSTSQEILDF